MRKVTRHAPDLAIEILSPGTSRNDRGRKLRMFERHRVREYWLVEPDRPSVEVYQLSETRLVLTSTATDGEQVESPLLPALDLQPSGLLPA